MPFRPDQVNKVHLDDHPVITLSIVTSSAFWKHCHPQSDMILYKLNGTPALL